MLANPAHDLVVKRCQFRLRNVGQPCAYINDYALREKMRVVVFKAAHVVRSACVDRGFPLATAGGNRRG